MGSIPHRGAKIPHAAQRGKIQKNKKPILCSIQDIHGIKFGFFFLQRYLLGVDSQVATFQFITSFMLRLKGGFCVRTFNSVLVWLATVSECTVYFSS